MATRPWIPTDYATTSAVQNALAAWHDPSGNGITQVAGSPPTVSKDADLGPNGFDEIQATAGKQPQYTTNSLNGLATEHFGNGTFRYFTSTLPANAAIRSFVCLVRYAGAGTATIYGASVSGGLQWRVDGGTPQLLKQGVALIGAGTSGSVPSGSGGAWSIVTASYNQSTGAWSFRVNGAPAGSGTSVQSLVSSTMVAALNTATGGEGWGVPMAERIGLNSDAVADLQYAEGYIAWKWGLQASLSANHPYKAAAPTVTTADTGASGSTSDAGAASDVVTASAAASSAATDAGVTTDIQAASAAAPASASDVGVTTDTAAGSAAQTGSASDQGAVTDTAAATSSAQAGTADIGAATSSEVASASAVASTADAGTASDAVSGSTANTGTATDAGSGADQSSAAAAASGAASDNGAGSDVAAARAASVATTSDAGATSDSISASQATVALVADQGAATDAVSATFVPTAATADAGASSDAVSGRAGAIATIADAGSSADTVGYVGQVVVPIMPPYVQPISPAGGGGTTARGARYSSYDPELHRRREQEEEEAQRPRLASKPAAATLPLLGAPLDVDLMLAPMLPPGATLGAMLPPPALVDPMAAILADDEEAIALLLAA